MRISDWSSDVCSSDLFDGVMHFEWLEENTPLRRNRHGIHEPAARGKRARRDRKSVVWGKSVSVRVDLGGRRIIKKKKNEALGEMRTQKLERNNNNTHHTRRRRLKDAINNRRNK